jgi:uncharacterized protein (DUF1697 family)
MDTYVTFLRGVNMSGHNSIKMADLTMLYVSLGFTDAKTFIQSGNVIFSKTGERSASSLSALIEKEIFEKFSYITPVMLRTNRELGDLFHVNPFLSEAKFDPAKMAVIFLKEEPSSVQLQKVRDIDYPPDKFKIIGREIFIYCPNGFGRTKLYTNFFEKKLGVLGTARNWKTITTIQSIICHPP